MSNDVSVVRPTAAAWPPAIGSNHGSTQPPLELDAAFEAGQVHVWRIDLDRLSRAAWSEVLRPEDWQRASRFVRQVHRDRFLQGRFCLLALLSAYSGCAAHALELRSGKHGKPRLPSEYGLGFNLSHSENIAVIAIGRAPSIGIDIERLVRPHAMRALAQQVFSEQEYAAFNELTEEQALLSFFVCWTRKEAVLKALGAGLTLDPRTIHVGLAADPLRMAYGAHRDTIGVETIALGPAVVSLAVANDPYRASFSVRDYATFFASETQP